MPRSLSQDAIDAISSGAVRLVVLVRIATSTVIIRMTSDTAETTYNGEVYLPSTLGGISTVKDGQDMAQSQMGLDFSGVDPGTLAIAASPDFLNSPVDVVLQVEGGGKTGHILIFRGFTAGSPSISYGNESRISVSCKGYFDALDRNRTERYADRQQQLKYPGDLGMEFASEVAAKEVVWPESTWFAKQG